MSLLNDMLRDLSARQADRPAEDGAGLLADSALVREEGFPWRATLVVFIGVLILVLAGQWIWYLSRSAAQVDIHVLPPEQTAIHSSPAMVSEAIPVTDNQVSVEQPVAQPQANQQSDDHEPPVALEVDDALQRVKAQLLQLAGRALARDRLSAPAGDNASGYYRELLALIPGDPDALAGLDAVTRRYQYLIAEAVEQGQASRARQLLRRARDVAPGDDALQALAGRLDEAADEASVPEVVASRQVADMPAADTHISLDSDARPVSAGQSSLSITPSMESLDRQAEAEALALWQAGQTEAARSYLEDVVARLPGADASARLLCHIYLETGDLAAAQRLLDDADDWPINHYARLRALWHQARNDDAEARALLETHLASAQTDESYRALLARLYYTGGDYHQAVTSYRRLLDSFGDKSGYWLGLALALDALGQGQSALIAYERTLALPPLDASVSQYIESRLRALSR